MSFYNEIETRVPNKSGFSRDYKNRLSLQFDYLYPTLFDETLPDDAFRVSQKQVGRFAPMLAPAFADVKGYTHYFYVPRRILDPFFKEFITDDSNVVDDLHKKVFRFRLRNFAQCTRSGSPLNVTKPSSYAQTPSVDGTFAAKKSLLEYLTGIHLAPGENSNECLDIAPFVAYQFIFNEYYRDSQIDVDLFNVPYKGLWWLTQKGIEAYFAKMNAVSASTLASLGILDDINAGILPITSVMWASYVSSSTPSLAEFAQINLDIVNNLFALRKRRYYRDYFTSARTQVTANEVPIVPVGFNDLLEPKTGSAVEQRKIEQGEIYVASSSSPSATTTALTLADGATRDNNGQFLFTKLGFTISALRLANALQKFGEKSVKFGLRYIEQIASHYGVVVSDNTAQIPVFCGGTQCDAFVSEVTQTSQSSYESAQGNYSGHMMVAENSDSFTIYCEEHGYIIGLTSYVADTAYTDGIHRMFQRGENRLNIYFPEFAMLTDQEVKLKELYFIKDTDEQTRDNGEIFGYQGRFDEYRVRNNEFHGEMDGNLDYWHLGRKFAHPSSLNWRLGINSYNSDFSNFPKVGGLYNEETSENYFYYDGVQDPPKDKNYILWIVTESYSSPTLLTQDNYITLLTEQLRDQANWAYIIANYNIFVGYIPYQWIVDSAKALIPNIYAAISSGLLIAMLENGPDFDDLVPSLNSSFIESHVSTRIFAETKDLEYLNDSRDYILGDDYIMVSFLNEVAVSRCMPLSAEPKL